MRSLAILTVKNEAAFLLEWLAHHRAVGFTDFLVFSNDCDDGTDAMLERLATLSADHFETSPDEINWGHVGTLHHYRDRLREITDSAFKEGEHAE